MAVNVEQLGALERRVLMSVPVKDVTARWTIA